MRSDARARGRPDSVGEIDSKACKRLVRRHLTCPLVLVGLVIPQVHLGTPRRTVRGAGFYCLLHAREGFYCMSESTDPLLDRLGDRWVAARRAEVPDLREVRAAEALFIEYFAWCVLEVMDCGIDCGTANPAGPRLGVIRNDGPVRDNPRGMSSPVKTDEIRAFEDKVRRVFGVDASATMEWPGE